MKINRLLITIWIMMGLMSIYMGLVAGYEGAKTTFLESKQQGLAKECNKCSELSE